jgi:hypothetical protein
VRTGHVIVAAASMRVKSALALRPNFLNSLAPYSPGPSETGEGGCAGGALCEGSETRRVTVDQCRVVQSGIEVGELGELGKGGEGGEGGELLRSRVDALTPNRHHSQRASSPVRWRGALWSLRRRLQFRVSGGWKGAVGGELTELTELPRNQGDYG